MVARFPSGIRTACPVRGWWAMRSSRASAAACATSWSRRAWVAAWARRVCSKCCRLSRVNFREAISDSIRYWEPRRLLYNAVLLLVVGGWFIAGWPASKDALNVDLVLGLFILAVLANVAYCAVYLPDLALQFST